MYLKSLVAVAIAFLVSGCGSAYVASDINDVAGVEEIEVVDISAFVVRQANNAPYAPQDLPDAFSLIASGSTPPRAPRLPDQVFDPEARPGATVLRAPPVVNPEPYRIGVGDVLILATPRGQSTVEELAGLVAAQNQRQGYTVQDDGMISVPSIGRIMVGGMTLDAAEDAIFQRLIDARIDPTFSLEIAEFNSQRVSVGGAVGSPGVVPITIQSVTLDEVLAQRGGVNARDADYTVIRIYRDGTLYQIPLNDFYAENSLRRLRMLSGDSVFVDTDYDLDLAQAFFQEQIARANYNRSVRAAAISELQAEISIRRGALQETRSNFQARLDLGAESREHVYIMGEVPNPGRFALPYENVAVLADVLLDAGGVQQSTGNPGQIYVMRAPYEDGTTLRRVTAYRLDGRNAANMVLATRFEMRPGDVVFVAAQPIARWNRFISLALPTLNLGNRLNN
ncbi:Polysaccharide export protein [Roseibacterium elongatum DSM 19469]|uniref:Polysaccharide export protein n=1 Tax=Roseicyclus elongatus DSM 19469 TaxID=1294273 RepID=W8S0S1_9RHOB|nr:polysaccharide biosynthesis/export family protein [Roseibacterium elongatum]AHM03757.1 Polysaccharide export protein [Roseibacterium elongatum DSM 19469]